MIAFDNRGAGQTDKPDGPYNVQMMADDTAGLMDALGIENAAVMGHSMGGFIAQQLALSRPDLVGKLILSATNFGGPRQHPGDRRGDGGDYGSLRRPGGRGETGHRCGVRAGLCRSAS